MSATRISAKRCTVFIVVLSGLWDRILQHLVARRRAGRNPNPTYAIIVSQSIDTAYASEQVGFDGGKKTKVMTDTLGKLLKYI